MNKDYYHFLTLSQKGALADEFSAGPQPAFQGVCPSATDRERLAIGVKRFSDKFLRKGCGFFPIRDRLVSDGYLERV